MSATILEAATAAIARMTKLKALLRKEGQEALSAVPKALFNDFPQIKTIYFAAYTPYFNDGEPCTFRVSEVNFSPVDAEQIDGPYYGEDVDEGSADMDFGRVHRDSRVTAEMGAAMKAVSEFMHMNEEALQAAYGEHVFVRIHKDGVLVEDYDHE